AADDEVLEAPADRQVAAAVQSPEIAREEPAVAVEAPLGGALIVEIAEHQRGAAAADLALGTGLGGPVGVVDVEEADLVGASAAPAARDHVLLVIVAMGV